MNILTATIIIEVAAILVFGWDLVRDAHRAAKRAKAELAAAEERRAESRAALNEATEKLRASIDRTNKILAQYR